MSESQRGEAAEPEVRYEYVSICQLTMPDPRDDVDLTAGDIVLQAGPRAEHGNAYSVYMDGDFVDIECDVLGILRPARPMTDENILNWAGKRIGRTNLMERLATYDNE